MVVNSKERIKNKYCDDKNKLYDFNNETTYNET